MQKSIEMLTEEKKVLLEAINRSKETLLDWEEICKEYMKKLSEVEAALNLISTNNAVTASRIMRRRTGYNGLPTYGFKQRWNT